MQNYAKYMRREICKIIPKWPLFHLSLIWYEKLIGKMPICRETCTRPFRPRPRRDPRCKGPRPRRDRDVWHFVRDETETETLRVWDETETETFQLPRHWPRRVVKKIKHHKINWTSKHHRGGGAQHSTLPSSATFSSVNSVSRIHRHTDEQHKNILPPTGLH